MATNNTRDVSLKLLVDTIGQDGVDKLRVAFDALAKEGASAAPEVKKLTDQIDRLSEQSAAITALERLGDEAQALATKEAAAAEAVGRLKTELDQQRASVDAARTTQTQANNALTDAQKALNETTGSIKLLRSEYDAAGRKTDEYRTKLAALLTAQVEQKNAIIDARTAQSEANKEFTEAVRAQTGLEAAQRKAAVAAQAAADAAQAQERALADAREAAAALGITTENLAQSESVLAGEIRTVVTAAEARVTAIREMAESDRLLAIEEQTMVDLLRRGEAALQAETLAQRDAARSALAYAEAKQQATANAAEWQAEAEGIVNAAEAAQRLSRETQVLAAAQQELGRQRTFEQQAADAQKLLKAADYVRFWETELQAAEDQARQTAEAAAQAAQRISDAFSTVGVRSVEQLRLEIANTRTAMATIATQAGVTGGALTGAFTAGEQRIKALEREIRDVTGQLTLADRAADLFKNSIGQIAAGNVIADGIGYLVNKIKELGREFIEVTVQTERMRKGLQAVYKDSTVAAQQFQFLRDAAQQSGFSVGATSDAFLRFSAATKSANLPLSVTNDLFLAVTRAGTTLGLTGEQVTGTLDALGQMASKGVVSMEELRQQLGDRLPGALSLAAQGLGITDQQLIKLVESGQLATRDFFPAFAAGLKTLAGDTDTLISGWARFTNMLNEFAVAVGDAGGLDVLKAGLSALAVALGVVLVPLQGFVEFLGLAGKAIGLFIGALTTGDFKGAFAEFDKQIDASASRIQSFHKSLDVAVNGIAAQEQAVAKSNVAMEKNAAGVLSVVAAQERLAAGTTAAGSAFVQQIVKLQENAVAVEAAVTASEKLLKAKQDEGKALVATATLTGDASKALDANALASSANAAASAEVVTARQREVTITEQSIALINAERDARGQLTSDRQAALDKLTATLVVQDAELEKSRQTTAELGRTALAAQAAAEAYADNSTKVDAYRQSMENARVVAALLNDTVVAQTARLAELKEQLIDGKITQEFYNQEKAKLATLTAEANKVTGDAAKLENLYRDAVKDSIAALDQKTRASQADVNVKVAQATAEQRHLETLAAVAKAQGNDALATEFSVQAKYKQIEAVRQAAAVRKLELDATVAQIEIERAALDPNDKLYAQKVKELDIRLQVVKAKRLEAGASEEQVRMIQLEIDGLRGLNSARSQSTSTTQGNTGALDANTSAMERNNAAKEKAIEVENKRRNVDANGFSLDKNGKNTVVAGGDLNTLTGIYNFLRSAGVNDEVQARKIANEFSDGKGGIPYMGNPGQVKYGGDTISVALLRAAEKVTFAKKAPVVTPPAGASTAATPSTGAGQGAAPAAASPRTININLNNRQYPINVADEQSDTNLTALLRELENKAGTAR